jgi:hypothetical protein
VYAAHDARSRFLPSADDLEGREEDGAADSKEEVHDRTPPVQVVEVVERQELTAGHIKHEDDVRDVEAEFHPVSSMRRRGDRGSAYSCDARRPGVKYRIHGRARSAGVRRTRRATRGLNVGRRYGVMMDRYVITIAGRLMSV